jgi:DNA-3-methyladenine glycosylase II
VSTDPVKYLSRVDPLLNKVIEAVGKYSIKFRHDPFQSLLESIIYQQLASAVASIIYKRFIKYYNGVLPLPSQILSTPDAILKIKVGLSSKRSFYTDCRS